MLAHSTWDPTSLPEPMFRRNAHVRAKNDVLATYTYTQAMSHAAGKAHVTSERRSFMQPWFQR